ncbi:MAG: hypothetical protein CMN78_03660 [Spirochaetales bacterium]|nr:hypothetical protein [Spirochaetales bacterium]
MSSFEKLQADLIQALEKNATTKANQVDILGKAISSLPKNKVQNSPYYELIKQMRELESQVDEKRNIIARWIEIEAELKDMRKKTREIDSRVENLADELEVYYESIGSAAFEMYSENPSVFSAMDELLAALQGIESNRMERERRLQQLESGTRPDSLLGKTLNKGRGLVLRGSLRTAEIHRNRQLRAVGERICGIDELPDFPESTPLGKALFPLKDLLDDLNTVRGKAALMQKQKTDMEDERVVIERKERMRNPLRNMEHEIDRIAAEITSIQSRVGEAHLEGKTRSTYSEESIAGVLADIKKHEAEERRLKKLMSRVGAALEIEALQAKKEGIGRELSSLRKQMEGLSSDQAKVQEKIEKQTKVRGSLSTLRLTPPVPKTQQKKKTTTTKGGG